MDIHALTLDELKQLRHVIDLRIRQLEAEQGKGKTLYLVEKEGHWCLVTPPLANGERKTTKLCRRLNHVEIIQQTMLQAPPADSPSYDNWLKYQGYANAPRAVELGLTVEGERDLQKLERSGYKIALP